MSKGILGRKVGMTQIYREDGSVVPVTVIQAGPCDVLQIRTGDRLNGLLSLREGFALSLGEAKSWKTALRCLTRMTRIY